VADFKVWDRTVLERFAAEASDRLLQMRAQAIDDAAERARLQAEIDALRADLRVALDAYRRVVTSTSAPCKSNQSR
jgi:macrodomain Ter protein organizer (MatP/YcbG family)